jgi:hypothetical protein
MVLFFIFSKEDWVFGLNSFADSCMADSPLIRITLIPASPGAVAMPAIVSLKTVFIFAGFGSIVFADAEKLCLVCFYDTIATIECLA